MRMRPTTLLATLLAVGLMPISAMAQEQGNNRPTPRQTIRDTNPADTYRGNAETQRTEQGTLTQQRTQGTVQSQNQQNRLQNTQIDGQPQVGQQGQLGGQQGMEQQLSLMVAAEMAIKNDCEIKTAQLVKDKAENDQVKQFAEMMIRDHQQMNQQLMQAMPQLSSMVKMSDHTAQSTTSSSTQTAQSTQSNEQRLLGDREIEPASPARQADGRTQPGVSNADRTAGTLRDPNTIRSQQEGQPTQRATGYRGTAIEQGSSSAMNPMMTKMLSICQKASDNHLQMTKKEFSEKQGKELDMCYMGSQVVMHQQTLAQLQALQGEGTPEFQQIVQQAEEKVSQHLSEAKSIVEGLTSQHGDNQSRSNGQSASPRPQGQPGQNN